MLYCSVFRLTSLHNLIQMGYLHALTIVFNCACKQAGGKVIGVGVHIYVYMWTKRNLNRTLAIDSLFKHSQ